MNLRILGLKSLCLFLLSLSLMACSTLHPAADQNMSWKARETQVAQVKTFKVQGSFVARQGKESKKASFHLTQEDEKYKLSLYGPLGMSHHAIKGDRESVSLTVPSGEKFTAKSPEILSERHLGWRLPLGNLRYWILGLPAEDKTIKADIKFDSFHRLQQLKQEGWIIHYENYTAFQNCDLPAKIRFEREDLQVVMTVNRWEVSECL